MEGCKPEWVEIALKYIAYSLRFHRIEPNSPQSRSQAEDMRLMISINAGELARFINSLLRGNIGKSFSEARAAEIAVAWSWATKTMAQERLELNREEEKKLIINCARRIGVDPDVALAFNAYLENYQLP